MKKLIVIFLSISFCFLIGSCKSYPVVSVEYIVNEESYSVKETKKYAENLEYANKGYLFDGWYISKNYTTKFDFKTKITSNMNLYGRTKDCSEVNKLFVKDVKKGVFSYNEVVDSLPSTSILKGAYLKERFRLDYQQVFSVSGISYGGSLTYYPLENKGTFTYENQTNSTQLVIEFTANFDATNDNYFKDFVVTSKEGSQTLNSQTIEKARNAITEVNKAQLAVLTIVSNTESLRTIIFDLN